MPCPKRTPVVLRFSEALGPRRTGAAHFRVRLKGWVVDVFAEVDSRPLWSVVIAKLVYRLWRRFPDS